MEEIKKREWSCDWIVTATNSENANVDIFRDYGTKSAIANRLAAMAVRDEICESTTKEEYLAEVDFSEPHRMQLVAYEDDDFEKTAFVYTAIEFSIIDFL